MEHNCPDAGAISRHSSLPQEEEGGVDSLEVGGIGLEVGAGNWTRIE
jgi:hypothetical protein